MDIKTTIEAIQEIDNTMRAIHTERQTVVDKLKSNTRVPVIDPEKSVNWNIRQAKRKKIMTSKELQFIDEKLKAYHDLACTLITIHLQETYKLDIQTISYIIKQCNTSQLSTYAEYLQIIDEYVRAIVK